MIRTLSRPNRAAALVLMGTAVLAASAAEAAPSLYFAVVGPAGVLSRGLGVTASHRLGRGGYEVIFNVDVTKCSFTATLGDPTAPGNIIPPVGFVGLAPRYQKPHGVFIATSDTSGLATDSGFYLQVICP